MARTLVVDALLLTATTISGPTTIVGRATNLLIAATLAVCAARLRLRDTADDDADPVTVP